MRECECTELQMRYSKLHNSSVFLVHSDIGLIGLILANVSSEFSTGVDGGANSCGQLRMMMCPCPVRMEGVGRGRRTFAKPHQGEWG
eukprot:COSAG02_NODE_13988_length_1323_cov_10.659314_3_plen_86_part_01